ncbi:Phosphate transport system permease protein PstA [Crateriforma conspicua]|uniref:Phosphate transport system permease protein PstA n=1 Tax=Crateriforma conspicua TaxID=2527996 RepID=A0A5C5Y146_9PLAN|nr:ABC transporter permease subunit [Crateriforma conspicua]QDV63955.1 Phosphate transport system permease protein PstA [Crateriforma conspicua]TWT69317.1 Phosphate transport system permease protein PstA [Crateriforma conspicua]
MSSAVPTADLAKSPVPEVLTNIDSAQQSANSDRRRRNSRIFYVVCVLIALLSVAVLAVLLASIGVQGGGRLTPSLLQNAHSELNPEAAGMWPSIIGSFFVLGVCGLFAIPLGIATAVYLEEFKPTSKVLQWFRGFIQLNIANLAGVPSIVYGLLGLSAFVYMFNIFGQIQVNESTAWVIAGEQKFYQVLSLETGQTVLIPQGDREGSKIKVNEPTEGIDSTGQKVQVEIWEPGTPKPTAPDVKRRTVRKGATGGIYSDRSWYFFRLPFGQSFLAGGLTLGLVILPIVIISSQEALRSVPPALREASLGLGSTTWQTVRHVSLPVAIPGILTGVILAMGRAIGEAAPILIVLGAAISKDSGPHHLMDTVVTMPLLIFDWAGRQQATFQELAAAAIIVLLVVLLMLNGIAIYLRQRMQQS